MKKKIAAVLASTAAAVGLCVIGAPAAHADGFGCVGTQIGTYPVQTAGGTVYANIDLFYNSGTGQNCAVTVSTTAGGYGTAKHMGVDLFVCSETTPGDTCTIQSALTGSDQGNYSQYAGPVSVSAAGKCILVAGQDTWNGQTANGSSTGASHCG